MNGQWRTAGPLDGSVVEDVVDVAVAVSHEVDPQPQVGDPRNERRRSAHAGIEDQRILRMAVPQGRRSPATGRTLQPDRRRAGSAATPSRWTTVSSVTTRRTARACRPASAQRRAPGRRPGHRRRRSAEGEWPVSRSRLVTSQPGMPQGIISPNQARSVLTLMARPWVVTPRGRGRQLRPVSWCRPPTRREARPPGRPVPRSGTRWR